jgi:hypothetical protein
MGVTSMAKDTKGEKLILDRGQGWHTDSPWDTEICKGTQLYGIEIPSYGGDTLFASMHAAYEALPERLKKRIAPLKVEFRYGGRERKWFDLLDPEDQARPPAVHDMVRVHPETGRKSLYVNPTHVIRIVGMPEAEGDRLLAELYWYMLQPNAEYRHKWKAGDLVIWDNRCTVHSAAGGYPSDERRIHWRESKLMQSIAPVSLVALPGRVLPPARSRARQEATAFVLTDLHLLAVKSASRHKRQWITQVPQPHPMSKLVRPQDAGKRIRRMSNDNYRSTSRTRRPCASVETISHVRSAEPNLLDNLNVAIHAMDSVALGPGLYDFWRIGRSEGADWTIPFECHVA